MLSHSVIQGYVIIFAPATKWMKQEKGILKALGQELLTSIFKHENMTVVEWVSNLEGVDSISISLSDRLVDFHWSHSVLIHTIIEFNISQKVHFLTRYQEVTLF